MTLNAIELVSTVVTKDSLHPLIKQSVYPIINVLAHFVLLTTEQVHKSQFNRGEKDNLRIYSDLLGKSIRKIIIFIDIFKQEKIWVLEPNQFVSDDEDEANMKSIRNLVDNLIF